MAKILFAKDNEEYTTDVVLVIPVEELMDDNPNYREVVEKEVGDFIDIDFFREEKETYPEVEEEFKDLIDKLADGEDSDWSEWTFFYGNAPMFNGTDTADY